MDTTISIETLNIDDALNTVAKVSLYFPADDRWGDIVDELQQFGVTYVDSLAGLIAVGCWLAH